MNAIQLKKIGFDSTENNIGNAIYINKEVIFITDNNKTAFAKVNEYLENNPIGTQRLGWDKIIYPYYTIKEISIL